MLDVEVYNSRTNFFCLKEHESKTVVHKTEPEQTARLQEQCPSEKTDQNGVVRLKNTDRVS